MDSQGLSEDRRTRIKRKHQSARIESRRPDFPIVLHASWSSIELKTPLRKLFDAEYIIKEASRFEGYDGYSTITTKDDGRESSGEEARCGPRRRAHFITTDHVYTSKKLPKGRNKYIGSIIKLWYKCKVDAIA